MIVSRNRKFFSLQIQGNSRNNWAFLHPLQRRNSLYPYRITNVPIFSGFFARDPSGSQSHQRPGATYDDKTAAEKRSLHLLAISTWHLLTPRIPSLLELIGLYCWCGRLGLMQRFDRANVLGNSTA
jgi:hypothetical protein